MLCTNRGRKMQAYIPDYVVFDLETTGISPLSDEVIEISAVKVRAGKVVDEFCSLVNPGRPIPHAASCVNGITDEMVAAAPEFADVLMGFIHFAGEDALVGHNIHNFDMKFIYRDAEKYYNRIPNNDYVDTLWLARYCLPKLGRHKLVDLAGYYGISTYGAHRALNDCHMNQQVYERLGQELKGSRNRDLKLCPRCGEILQRRNGRFGEFWGCSGYPRCRYTENI